MKCSELVTNALSESSAVGRGCISMGRLLTIPLVAAVVAWDSCYIFMAWTWNRALLSLHTAVPAGLTQLSLLPDASTLVTQGGFMTLFYAAAKWAGAYTDSKTGANIPEQKGN